MFKRFNKIIREVKMTTLEKIELINTLHESVIDYVIEGDLCLEVLAPLNEEAITVLKQLGKDEEWIRLNKIATPEDGYLIDLAPVGFEFSGWWTSDNGFE
ncbi:hypothetical protein JIMMER1_95 [Brevibacillus phage Jimmer1]|uniref:Uncharacterized protein n=4 Tax=Jimmervirus TaxID=1984788 RepID=S5MNA7_9CAUD|nr:hypothetical protein AVV10_gp095 [Brevibacillus phage Osiris]YP_009226405.1 hypothetical protein AXJ21_gp095 [Brevibacillus phage Jimmer1]YP_009606522.1 hypothetical protein FDI01_gp095 [Brevibacillus phage Jimmer2]ALA48105.1 hypothetical protein POWDER_95 [Brevibacillus phage Powder]AGR47245.1 hypothetical protein JIMMER2_95 [Brevibacillus phage Jimmer2]AGR47323.1 hypothetical protein JIMMER1_95 [Brevibacillus phage Jimmer1]ALA07407.1 hypothetical protein OSIRIS_95 [Brevibacillus phage Os